MSKEVQPLSLLTIEDTGIYHKLVPDNQGERVEKPGFDQILQRLREVVGQLEAGNLSLEESLRAYEEGVGLARRGHSLLDGAEKRVELLVRDQKQGTTAVPFDAAGPAPGPRGADEPD